MTRDHSSTEEADLGARILSYLAQHPDARDTCDGIVEWWFLEQGIRHAERSVRQALRQLVRKGLLLERRLGGSRIQYRLNQDRLPQIRAQLEDRAAPKTGHATGRRADEHKDVSCLEP